MYVLLWRFCEELNETFKSTKRERARYEGKWNERMKGRADGSVQQARGRNSRKVCKVFLYLRYTYNAREPTDNELSLECRELLCSSPEGEKREKLEMQITHTVGFPHISSGLC